MNILVLGYSTIFRNRMLVALEKTSGIQYIDIASRTRQLEPATSPKIRTVYTSYEEALKQSDAEIVYVSVRNHEHVAIAKQALLHDKHVVVDKPAALSSLDARMLIELAGSKNKCIAEALVYQYHPQIEMTKELFHNAGILPSHVSVNFTIPGLNGENFRYDALSGGGAIYDMAAYAMGIGRNWFDTPLLDCVGFKKSDGHGVETAFSLSLAYGGNGTLSGFFGFETEYMNAVTVFGKGMSVHIDRVFTPPAELENTLHVKSGNQSRTERAEKGDTFQLFMEDVLGGIQKNDIERFGAKLLENTELLDFLNRKLIPL
jgi:NDP-hexose-3-ketoreductase